MEIDYSRIPKYTIESIQEYVKNKVPPGDFLRAVFENNLTEAFGRADKDNLENLFQIVAYLYNEVNSACWGTPQKVKDWLESREKEEGRQDWRKTQVHS